MAFDVLTDFNEIIRESDIYGTIGTSWFTPRTNLLVDIPANTVLSDSGLFTATVWMASGASFNQMQMGIFPQSAMKELEADIVLNWGKNQTQPLPTGKTLLWNVAEVFPVEQPHHAQWIIDDNSKIYNWNVETSGPLRILELFSGGHGGWAYAIRYLQHAYQYGCQTFAVDNDLRAVQTYSITHGASIVNGGQPLPSCLMSKTNHVVAFADITGEHWLKFVSGWRPDVATISAPCQPWASTGEGKGLACQVGRLLPESLVVCRKLRIPIIMIEQVPGFPVHPHATLIQQQLRAFGYSTQWSRVIDSGDFGCASRKRWLTIASLIHEPSIIPKQCVSWPSGICPKTPIQCGSIVDFNDEILKTLEITETAKRVASDQRFLPKGQRSNQRINPEVVLASRASDGTTTLPTFMAMYGRQHDLSQDQLLRSGYLGHFHKSHNGNIRCWHPLEIALHHTVWDSCATPTDLIEGWKFQGNQITMPHAVLVLANAINMIPHRACSIPIHEALQGMWDSRLTNENSKIVSVGKTLVLTSLDNDSFDSDFQQHCQSLDEATKSGCFPFQTIWNGKNGWTTFAEIQAATDSSLILSQITVPTEVEATQTFCPLQMGRIVSHNGHASFWFASDIPLIELEYVWDQHFQSEVMILEDEETIGYAIELKKASSEKWELPHPDYVVVTLIQQQCLSLFGMNRIDKVTKHLDTWGITSPIFDQFGPVTEESIGFPFLFLGLKEIMPAPLEISITIVAAAMTIVHPKASWDQEAFSFLIEGHGLDEASQITALFWESILSQDSLQQFGLWVSKRLFPGSFVVKFESTTSNCPIPPQVFWIAVVVQATRRMMAQFADDQGTPLSIKWKNRKIWEGKVIDTLKVCQIEAILKWTLTFAFAPAEPRLVHKGQSCTGSQIVSNLSKSNRSNSVLLHVSSSLEGGGFNNTQKTQAKNSIASTLLEAGYDLKWVAETTDAIMTKGPIKTIMKVSQLAGGIDRKKQVMQLCQDCSVQIPSLENKVVKAFAQTAPGKFRKQQQPQPLPEEYRIEPGYIKNADGTEVDQIFQVSAMATGLCLMTLEQATPWIRESQVISKDELGLFVIGSGEIKTSLSCKDLLLPCRNLEGQQVIIAGKLIQLGAKTMEQHSAKNPQVQLADCQVIALTIWKDDWNETEWQTFLKSTATTIKTVLGEEGGHIISLWGRSLRFQGKPAKEEAAQSIQIHGTFPKSELPKLLAKSGFCKIFVTPKNAAGRICDQWRVIWIPGDLAHVTTIAAKFPFCCGMIKGKTSLGLRFSQQKFPEAWATINPGIPVPVALGGETVFKIQPLPFGCTGDTLQQWASQNSWTIKAIKAVGSQCWLVASNQDPPEGVLVFNGNPIIIRVLPPKIPSQTNAIVAGPKPRSQFAKGPPGAQPNDGFFGDPWAEYRAKNIANPIVAPAQRTVAGPIESQFQQQEARISTLEQSLKDLQIDQKKYQEQTIQEFQEAKKRDLDTKQFVTKSIVATKQELTDTVEKAIAKQSTALNASLEELKSMFRSQTKRGREADHQEMSD